MRVRLNCLDAYIRGSGATRVPVVRVYGPRAGAAGGGGLQTTVHVCGVFPYLYVPLPDTGESAEAFSARLNASISEILDPTIVYRITPCLAYDMYGFHIMERCFLKIELRDFGIVNTLAESLAEGTFVGGGCLQPYMAHIPYLMSFLADNDLYGCGWMEFSKFRDLGGGEIEIDAVDLVRSSSEVHLTGVSSLNEIRQADQLRREAHGLSKWPKSNTAVFEQRLSHAWNWERAKEYRSEMEQWAERDAKLPLVQVNSLPNYPTAKELLSISKNTTFAPQLVKYPPKIPTPPSPLSSEASNDFEEPSSITQGIEHSTFQEEHNSFDTSFIADQSHIEALPGITDSAAAASRILEAHFSQRETPAYCASFVSGQALQFQHDAPTTFDVKDTYGVVCNQEPFFGNAEDAQVLPFKYGGRSFHVKSSAPKDLPPFTITLDPSYPRLSTWIIYEGVDNVPAPGSLLTLEYALPSPTSDDVRKWMEKEERTQSTLSNDRTTEVFQLASLGSPPNSLDADMSMCVLEVLAANSEGNAPVALEDPVVAVCFRFEGLVVENGLDVPTAGVITSSRTVVQDRPYFIVYTESELEIIEKLIAFVNKANPDILCGYEMESGSWGYLRERYMKLQTAGDVFYPHLGRCAPHKEEVLNIKKNAESVRGRHLLSLSSIMRKEVHFSKYSLEYVVMNALHRRIPYYNARKLNEWWNSGEMKLRSVCVNYLIMRVDLVAQLFAHFEIINKTCEQSRIIGVDFMSCLTRGSQFQVESILCKLANSRNYLMISPTKAQVSGQNALEQIPLVMEPKSAFYTDPVCVLDFRSLYPSIITAFNLCYSTCIGKITEDGSWHRFGVKEAFGLAPGVLSSIGGVKSVYVAPNGVGYVSPSVRRSLLAQMLTEILDTRFMINDTRKKLSGNGGLSPREDRNLNSQQLALKLIANVTYGYASASFSGRMPCAELADSVVLAGKELLLWAIRKTETMASHWGINAEVVYGDTDSLFVKFPNVSVEQAFRLGTELAEAVTAGTPDPILLKLEKVYSPSILLTKKRYVGRAFESSRDLTISKFDAKGIETVRRDGVPITQKMEKRALEILFSSKDLSKVKTYLCNKWRQILATSVKPIDFCFAREVRIGIDHDQKLSGGATVALKAIEAGERGALQHKERVPYLVVSGPPGTLINDRVMSPEEYMRTPNVNIDAEYYIRQVINPPLARLFNLAGANIEQWFNSMPRPAKSATKRTPAGPYSVYALQMNIHDAGNAVSAAHLACRQCSGSAVPSSGLSHPCTNLDCSVYHDRCRYMKELSELL